MKIIFDRDRCIGSGQCLAAAPTVFTQSDDGLVDLVDAQPGEEMREEVMDAVDLCPARVIAIED